MDYILYHKGLHPQHLSYCINSILSTDEDSKVHLITNIKKKIKGVNVVDIKDFKEYSFTSNYKKDLRDFGRSENPLWITSLERIFYINEYIKIKNINKFVHFDNDVILYQPFSKVDSYFINRENTINITPLNSENMVFGYSYVNSINKYEVLAEEIKEIVINHDFYKNKYNQNKPLNEMKIISIAKRKNPNLINELDTLPYKNQKFIFDPASYGQYLGGTHKKPNSFFRKKFATQTHTVGMELISQRIKVNFNKGTPTVTSQLGDCSFLVNLHIHSKKLEKFLPIKYKSLI